VFPEMHISIFYFICIRFEGYVSSFLVPIEFHFPIFAKGDCPFGAAPETYFFEWVAARAGYTFSPQYGQTFQSF
jgi:hypothetical protein